MHRRTLVVVVHPTTTRRTVQERLQVQCSQGNGFAALTLGAGVQHAMTPYIGFLVLPGRPTGTELLSVTTHGAEG